MKAFRNIIRSPQRSFVLILLLFALITVLLLLLCVHGVVSDSLEESVGPLSDAVRVTSTYDYPRITLGQAKRIEGAFGIILEHHAITSAYCDFIGLNVFEAPDVEGVTDIYAPLTITGVTSLDIVSDFYSGERFISSGGPIKRSDNESKKLMIVISKELAELNGLKIGDAIRVRAEHDSSTAVKEEILYVSGIYTSTISLSQNVVYDHQMPGNQVYIPMSVFTYLYEDIIGKEGEITLSELYYTMKDTGREAVDALQTRLRSIVSFSGTGDIRLTAFASRDDASMLRDLSRSINISIVAVVICFVISLAAVLIWNVQSRMREIGTYCALGAKRGTVARMLSRETVILLITALILSAFLCFLIINFFGGQLYSLVSLERDNLKFETSLDGMMYADAVESIIEEELADPVFLQTTYLLPAVFNALAVFILLILFVHFITRVIIARLDIIKVMGGNAA